MLSARVAIALLLTAIVGAQTRREHEPAPANILGTSQEGAYRNNYFGFSCKLPYGWVERTEQMRRDAGDASKGLVLLSAFERPPEAKADTVNSAVLIAAESVSSYPGLKTAADYFEPLTEVATTNGFKVVNEPYEVHIGTRQLVRSDFSKQADKEGMYQASLVTLERGYIVSFTFVGTSEDDVGELMEGLNFAPIRRPK